MKPRYVPRITAFSAVSEKEQYLLSSGTLFSLKKEGDALVPAFGLDEITVDNMPASAEAAYFTSAGNLYVYSSGTLYRCTGAYGNFYVFGSGFSSAPFFAECHEDGEDYVLICDGTKALRANSSSVQSETCPPVRQGVVHYSRLFGIDADDSRTVRWSEPGNARGWTEGINGAGFVRLDAARGEINKLVVWNNRLVAVRESGLTVIRAFGEAESFKVDVTDTDTDEIAAETVSVCGGKLYFFTSTGLYSYDGGLDKCTFEGLHGFKGATCAAACGGYIYAAGKLRDEDVVACIDAENGDVSYIRQRADCICARGRVFFYGDGLFEILADGSSGEWESGPMDFGTPRKKYLRSISVSGADSITVTSGANVRAFAGAEGEVPVGMCGREFYFSAKSSGKLRLLCARYSVRG